MDDASVTVRNEGSVEVDTDSHWQCFLCSRESVRTKLFLVESGRSVDGRIPWKQLPVCRDRMATGG